MTAVASRFISSVSFCVSVSFLLIVMGLILGASLVPGLAKAETEPTALCDYPGGATAGFGAELPWVADGCTGSDLIHWATLWSIANVNPGLAEKLLVYAWVRDGLNDVEISALGWVGPLVEQHPDLARAILDSWWFAEAADAARHSMVFVLHGLARDDIERAEELLRQPFMEPPFRDVDTYALAAIAGLSTEERDFLFSQAWVLDGISDEEAALISAMYGAAPSAMREGFADRVSLELRTVTTSLAGEVHLFLIEEDPATDKDGTFRLLEQGIGWIEEYLGEPFPADSVVLVLAKDPGWNISGRTYSYISGHGPHHFSRRLMVIASGATGPLPTNIYHELAHYYHLYGPRWLSEGAATFLEMYGMAQSGGLSLEKRVEGLDAPGGSCSPNIVSHLENRGLDYCDYGLGASLFLDLHAKFGADVVGAAIRELFELSISLEYIEDDAVYDALLAGVPPARLDEFNDIYRRRHGGPQADGDPAGGAERRALTALFEATGGTSWLDNRNWLSDSRVGVWHGVVTYNDGRVAHVSLDRNGLKGGIPPALAELEEVNTLELSANSLTGPIPLALGTLTKLSTLSICCNRLSGTIPEELGDLDLLRYLHLSGNQLSGAIPRALGRLDALRTLDLAENSLAGSIPGELGDLRELRSLGLNRNRLEGAIPESLGGLDRVESLNLSENRLTGPIPPELGRLPNLEYLLLDDNQLSGSIPSSLGAIEGLLGLYLAGNDLVGCIPVGLRDVPDNDFDELGLPFCPEPVAVVSAVAEAVLEPGWTLVRWEGDDHVGLDEATQGVQSLHSGSRLDALVAVYAWDGATRSWLAYYASPELSGLPGPNTLATLRTGYEYWVAVAEPATWTASAP